MKSLVLFALLLGRGAAAERPPVFPIPQKLDFSGPGFEIAESVVILVPQARPQADLRLARVLSAELSDRYGLAIRIEGAASLPAGRRFILMGSIANPLVRQYAATHSAAVSASQPGPEGYILRAGANEAVVAGSDEAGAFYGMQSLRQLIGRREGKVLVPGVSIEDKPHLPFRAIRLYLPGHDNIAFFKRFLRDFMALYKFNKVIVEVNASMRFDRHPELNAGWINFAKDLYYTQRYNPRGPNGSSQNSAHHDAADGEILEKDEVRDLVDYARSLHIEVIPEIPTLTHSYYFLTRHKEFGAIRGAEWPDTYCPTDPGIYKLVFDVIDEYVEVMRPKMIHIGHDEMFFPLEACRCCQGRGMSELYAQDVRTLHGYLSEKGIKVGMYGDHLIESVRGIGSKPMKSHTGWEYNMPGALTPQQVKELIPKDILIFNWFWQDIRAAEGRGEPNDVKLADWGFKQAYINFTPFIDNFGRRSTRPSVTGGSPSSWSATNEYTIGKDLMVAFLGTANLMWSTHWPESRELNTIVQLMLPDVRRNLRGKSSPAEDGNPMVPVDLTPYLNSTGAAGAFDLNLSTLRPGRLLSRGRPLEVPNGAVIAGTTAKTQHPLARDAGPIPVGEDASALVFLHASARHAANDMSYRYIHNFPDTADLLGWYDVVYEDGFVETVPVRFGVNILPLDWGSNPGLVAKGNIRELSYAYEADLVECGSASLFAYEWVNPRFGKTIKEVRLHGTAGFLDTKGKPTPDNAIVLAGLTIVKKKPVPGTEGKP
jgi:hypothetical protein